ncbi:MAG: hypothetical protein OHK0029_09440 [Armatimonadaceae bacterium]
MAKTETLGRGHTVRVMPTESERKRNRLLASLAATAVLVGGAFYARVAAQSGLNSAAGRGDTESVKRYLGAGYLGISVQSALQSAIKEGRGNIVRHLLATGLVSPVDGLSAAAQYGQVHILRLLMEKGANVSGEMGGALLWRAAQSGSKDTVYLLLQNGAKKDLPNQLDDSLTPLMYAAHSGQAGVVKALVDAGANVKVCSTQGRTALMIAAAWNDPAACKYLIQARSEINAQDKRGQTALMSAAVVGNYPALKYLLAAGANTKVKDAEGKTALDHAIEKGDTKSANILRSAR